MTSMVYSNPQSGAATHLLVVGVGHYPALLGGGGTLFAKHEGMSQLQSPPASACAFARWMIEHYQSPLRPLASVRLLVSEASPQPFVYTHGGAKVTSQPTPVADMAGVRAAILEWEQESKNVDDLMLFYFCGHGITGNSRMALLLSDFGEQRRSPFAGALDFLEFRKGMEDCTARQQCYFIDACRLNSTLLRDGNYAGDSVVQPSLAIPPGGRMRIGPTFYSTLAGDGSYGESGQPSVFTRALLDSLAGLAASKEDGQDWTVKTCRLQTSLQFLMNESIRINRWGVLQEPMVNDLQDFQLNTLTQLPPVPVIVTVDPMTAHVEAALRYDDGNGNEELRLADEAPWSLRLPKGSYSFHADFASGRYDSVSIHNQDIYPPYQHQRLKAVAK